MQFIDFTILASETNPKIEALRNRLDQLDPDKKAKKSIEKEKENQMKASGKDAVQTEISIFIGSLNFRLVNEYSNDLLELVLLDLQIIYK